MKKIFSVTKNLTVNFGLGLNYGPGTAQQIILNGGGKINNFRLNYYWKYPVGSLSTSGHQIFSVGMDFGQPATPISLRQPALPTTTIPAVPQPVSLTVIPGIAAYLVTISSPAVSEVFTTTITAPTPLPTTITEVSSGTIPTSVFSSTAPAPALKKPKPRELPLIRTHPVAAGETLPEIAERYYGNKNDWPKIYQANEDKIEKGLLVPGTVLIIP
jgi:LysM repeat protein